MQRKGTGWEEIHDVLSDYLQVVESQVMHSFVCMFSKSSLVNMNYLQKRKNVYVRGKKTEKDSSRKNKSK